MSPGLHGPQVVDVGTQMRDPEHDQFFQSR